MAGKGDAFLGWTIGGVGAVLLYGAYKNESPLSLIKKALTGGAVTPIQTAFANSPSVAPADASTGGASGISGSDTQRAAQLKGRHIQPDLVGIGQGNMSLDRTAAAAFHRAEQIYGRPITLTGAWRSTATQAKAYAVAPGRFAPPGNSLHEVGLAVDVSTAAQNVDDPKLVNAMTQAGWFRQGKVINGRPEPWHWSYGVPG